MTSTKERQQVKYDCQQLKEIQAQLEELGRSLAAIRTRLQALEHQHRRGDAE